MIEGIDYCYIYPKTDDTAVHIKLLDGPYKDTTFKYGRVKFEEKDEQMYFNYKEEETLNYQNGGNTNLVNLISQIKLI
jgi:hypothetical protein